MTFPQDLYTPYGYLNLPRHTRRLSPLGVLRSQGVGFLWHFPAYTGGYGGRRFHYAAGFYLSLDGISEIAALDEVYCPYHSGNLMEFQFRRGAVSASALFHPVGDHACRCRVELRGAGLACLGLHALYRRQIGAGGEWGESGLVGRPEGEDLALLGFEGGETFLLHASRPAQERRLRGEPAGTFLPDEGPAPGILCVPGQVGQVVALLADLEFEVDLGESPQTLEFLLARGPTVPLARAALERAREGATVVEAKLRAEDARFWESAPQLEGDWPERFRRGLVYDLETVRMMVKPPLGIYRFPWDAMQIQSPRLVLAETAMDALLLAYGDPATAGQLLLSAFADAPEPNVPCTREDGSYNMVAADGTACGTSPAWGYPWRAIEQLSALYPERYWLELLYPHLAEYLEWWLAHRRDAEGWLFYACSWESGQDDSPRFGEQPLGGGHPVRHIRPVDLHAAMAHATQVMAGLAERLGHGSEQARWQALALEFRERTEQLWNGRRYADYDRRAGRPTEVDDVMLLAPVALGVARPERVAGLRPAIAALDARTLTWPMFAWTAVEAALQAGLYDKAAELAGAVCQRAYGFWDAREPLPGHPLPGIAAEYWPPDGRCGGEGYGWGAFTTHLVLHVLVGLSFSAEQLLLRPNLPPPWRQAGQRFGLHWSARGRPLFLALEPLSAERVRVTLQGNRCEAAWGETLSYRWEALAG